MLARMKRILIPAIVLVALTAPTARAHHSYAAFNREQTVSIEGDLVQVMFVNPHVVLTLRTRDEAVYRAEWQAAFQLQRGGVTVETLRPGDHVIVSGAPARDEALRLVSLLTEVRRPSDGWQWRRQ